VNHTTGEGFKIEENQAGYAFLFCDIASLNIGLVTRACNVDVKFPELIMLCELRNQIIKVAYYSGLAFPLSTTLLSIVADVADLH